MNPVSHADTGAIMVEVSCNEYYTTTSLQIRDCSRKIELDFSARNKSELKERLKKVDTMIDTLTEMRSKMEEGFEFQQMALELLEKEKKDNPELYTVIRGDE